MAGAGGLRDRVSFQAEQQTPDGGGGYALAWAHVITVWGELRLERGREKVEAGRLEAADGGVLRVRSSIATRAITEANRVLINSEPYQIKTIANPDRKNQWLEMVVMKGVAT